MKMSKTLNDLLAVTVVLGVAIGVYLIELKIKENRAYKKRQALKQRV